MDSRAAAQKWHPAGPPLVELRGVSRQYDSGAITALSDVSLAVGFGESVSILGPSGSGKSTLMNLMSGMDRPTGGEVWCDGARVDSAREWGRIRARRVGYVFQAFHLLPVFTALENVQIPMFEADWRPRERRRRAVALLEAVGLRHRLGHLPARLSSGERQRVAIARSLANGPSVLLADEPTGNLDPETSEEIVEVLDRVNRRGTTVVMATHDRQPRQPERRPGARAHHPHPARTGHDPGAGDPRHGRGRPCLAHHPHDRRAGGARPRRRPPPGSVT